MCEHGLDPELCNECNQASNGTFTVVDSVDDYAARLKAEHPTWIIMNRGWGISVYDPDDPRWRDD